MDRSYTGSCQYVPRRLPERAFLHTLLAFVDFLRSELDLSNAAISVTLASLRYEFRSRMFDSPALQSELLYQAARANVPGNQSVTVLRGRRIPFTTDMVLSMSPYADAHPHPRHRMRAIGALLGYFCALRASEYCVCPYSDHTIRAEAIEFEYRGDLRPSSHAFALRYAHVTAVRITVHTAKNIAPGKGQSVGFAANRPGPHTFPLAAHLFSWAQQARLSPGDIFLSYPTAAGERVPLRYSVMNSAIKAAAAAAGVDPAGCGTHGLRGGAATSLSAAGASDACIMNAGRWRSLPSAAAYPDRTAEANDHQLDLLHSSSVSTRDIRMACCLPPRHMPTTRSPPPTSGPRQSPLAASRLPPAVRGVSLSRRATLHAWFDHIYIYTLVSYGQRYDTRIYIYIYIYI